MGVVCGRDVLGDEVGFTVHMRLGVPLKRIFKFMKQARINLLILLYKVRMYVQSTCNTTSGFVMNRTFIKGTSRL